MRALRLLTVLFLCTLCFAALPLTAQTAASGPDPAKVDPAHFSIEFEDAHVRVLRLVIPAGETTPLFEIREHVVVVVRGSRLVFTDPAGTLHERVTVTGETSHSAAEVISIRNIGNITFEGVITELKDGVPATAAKSKFPVVPPDREIVVTPKAEVVTPEEKKTAQPTSQPPVKRAPETARVPDASPRQQPPAVTPVVPAAPSTAAAVLDRPTVLTAPIPGAKAVKVNNAQLTYYEQGSGAPVVFVHGLLEDLRSWSRQVDDFSTRFRAITYSRRINYPNPSTGREDDYTYQQNADDLSAFLRELNLGPVHLVAHSYGASVAAMVAAQHPELVKSLVLMEPGFEDMLPPARADAAKYSRLEILGIVKRAFGKQKTPEHGLQVYYDWNRGSGSWDGLTLEQQQRLRDNQNALAALSRSPEAPNFSCTDAARIKAPVLAVTGERSTPNMHAITDALVSCIAGAQKLTIPGAGHAMHLDDPDAFDRGVLQFLTGK